MLLSRTFILTPLHLTHVALIGNLTGQSIYSTNSHCAPPEHFAQLLVNPESREPFIEQGKL